MTLNKFFEVKARYYGNPSKSEEISTVTEDYLVDALSIAEAEALTVKELKPYIKGDFDMLSAKRSNYSEVLFARGLCIRADRRERQVG